MPWIEPARWDTGALTARWRAAQPFPHLVLDALLPPEAHAAVAEAFAAEPASRIHDEIFEVMASAVKLEEPTLRRFEEELGRAEVRAALERITGKTLARVEARAYAYLEGHYLLPHADHQAAVGRSIAFAYYVDCRDLEGGELELFDCTLEGGEVVASVSAAVIPPAPNRIVLFEVSDASIHQVREVTRGARLSLAGWFYP